MNGEACVANKIPYLIYIPDWQRDSGGVRTCHYLAHLLNEYGYPCALVGNTTNPAWDTPCLGLDPHKLETWHDRGAILILPDMYEGHPCRARSRVLRYICNRPGFFTGTKRVHYPPAELQVPFTRLLNTQGAPDEDILFLPYIETDLFCPSDLPRDRACFWIGKRSQQPIDDSYGREAPRGIVQITHKWPKTRRELAQLFQASTVCYSFDDLTAIVTEANLCGCPAVIIPSGDYTRDAYLHSELGLDGIAWGTEELDRARATVDRCYENYLRETAKTEARVRRFILRTQEYYARLSTAPVKWHDAVPLPATPKEKPPKFRPGMPKF